MSNPKDQKQDTWSSPKESLEVVLVKKGVNPLEAKPEDFERVGVTAASPTEAVQHPDVEKKVAEGFVVLQAANPTHLTDFETQARARQTDSSSSFEPGW